MLTSVTTIHYIARKSIGTLEADAAVGRLLALIQVAPVTESVLAATVSRGFSDFEEAVLDAAAQHVNVDAPITREVDGFRLSRLQVFRPSEFVGAMNARRGGR